MEVFHPLLLGSTNCFCKEPHGAYFIRRGLPGPPFAHYATAVKSCCRQCTDTGVAVFPQNFVDGCKPET